MSFGIIALILGIVTAFTGAAVGLSQSQENARSVSETNETNLQAVRETNSANVEQAELAYRRSLPTAQVRNLMSAGMSRAGALSALTGGGSYTAPVLQSSHGDAPQMDLSAVMSSLDRLQGIPSNVEQSRLVDEQIKALSVDTQNKLNADQRANEKHELDIWNMKYGKELATRRDSFNSYLDNYASEHNIDWNTVTNKQELINAFGLRNNREWNSLPKSIQDEFANDAILRSRENIAKQQQNNANIAAMDSHDINSQNLLELKSKFKEWKEGKNLRAKERALAESETALKQIMSDMNLTAAELKKAMNVTTDKNGNVHVTPHKGIQGVAKEFWETAGAIVGLDYLGDIIGRILLPLGK